ncbi:T9SS type A sorting domain-containing protein [Hymenobacter sp. HMF4947]|uniref:T9SS type A sorting domain-containing protein n=1 Tax=Hymenobacter ginkgonis TaxID=2682976 RepID=A0A7K1T8Z2_9BACT|nr:PQQ-dependent sugar dehydrogenase [Hymenobacter ginkgonis]MVN74865.1 T9SS type A sorting domain-containing protein [Hymenobacter ginkgonis]
MKNVTICWLAGALALASCHAQAQSGAVLGTYQVGTTTLTATALTTGLRTPWELLWGPDNFLWMTERGGRISRVNPTTGQVLPLLTVADVTETGESGLLGMALHPDLLGAAPYVYVVYNYTASGALKEKLVRLTYSASTGTLGSPLVLLDNISSVPTHNGSRLLILPDRTLLMTTGDAQNQPEAQSTISLNGKILRLNLDGTAAADNPTPGSRLYTFGHRNPQGLVQAPSGKIYSSEHGPDNDDEVNLIEPGRNYGWPTVQGFCNLTAEQTFCTANNVREPLVAYTPTLAVAGITYYNNPAVPGWDNSLLMTSLKAGTFIQLQLNADGTQITSQTNLWAGTYGRLRAVCVSPQGRVYLSTSNQDGRGNPGATDDRVIVLENRAYLAAASASTPAPTLSISPNPASALVSLRRSNATGTAAVRVFDGLGRAVRQASFAAGQTDIELPLSGLAAGLYVVETASLTNQPSRARLVVQ